MKVRGWKCIELCKREDPPFLAEIPLFSCVTLIISVIPPCLQKPWMKALCCKQYSHSLRDLNLLSVTLLWKIGLAPSSTLSPQFMLMLSTKIPGRGNRIEFIPARNHPPQPAQPRSGWRGSWVPPPIQSCTISSPHTLENHQMEFRTMRI